MKKKLSVIMINRNLKHIAIFFLINTILFLSNCFDTNAKERKKRNEDNKVALLQVIGLSCGSKEVGTVVDNKDGTLTYTYQLLQTNGWLGNKVISQRTILIRRCLIGQVYRTAQNDCQGTGTKDTVWGASQLQWCPTNDRSCEKDGKADPIISPAAKACATDTFAGKKWVLVSKDDGLWGIRDYNKTYQSIYRDWDGDYSGLFFFWSNESSGTDTVYYPMNPLSSFSKTNSKINILCKGEQGI